MRITLTEQHDHEIISIEGEINLTNINELRDVIGQCVRELSKNLVLDMKDVYLIDSTGIAVLFATQKKVESLQRKFYLTNVNEMVGNIISITGINFNTIKIEEEPEKK